MAAKTDLVKTPDMLLGLGATLKIDPEIDLQLFAHRTEGSWRFKGDAEIPGGLDLVALVARLVGTPGPDLSLNVYKIGVEFTSTADYAYLCHAAFGSRANPKSATLIVTASVKEGTTTFGGQLELGPLQFNVLFVDESSAKRSTGGTNTPKTSSTTFVATCTPKRTDSRGISLRSIVASVSENAGWVPDLSIDLKYAIFAYRHDKLEAAERTRLLFGLKLNLDAAFRLSDLPLIGKDLKGPRSELRFQELELLIATGAFNKTEAGLLNSALAKAPREAGVKEVETGSRLPDEIVGGIRLNPKLLMGGEPVDMPVLEFGSKPPELEGPGNTPAVGAPAGPPATDKPARAAYQLGPLFLRSIDLGFDSKTSEIELRLTGGVRFSKFELELINAGVRVPLSNPGDFKVFLGGLAIAVKAGSVSIAGAFMKLGEAEYGGLILIDLVKFSITAMGLYSEISIPAPVGTPPALHPPASAAPDGKAAVPAGNATSPGPSGSKLPATKPLPAPVEKATSLFIYGALSITGGGGIPVGPLVITGFALGVGLNRRVIIPPIEEVAEFPLVKMAMGTSDTKIAPGEALQNLAKYLPPELGQNFGCVGVRFTVGGTVDCFALGIVQFGNELEIALLGLARFAKERICYVELALKILFKPSVGLFLAQAQLTDNSWVLDKDCRLTGGFALAFWFGGPNKGDFVITIGGYHPRFKKPPHYPVVPRLGINWAVTKELQIKGELYCAITPSAMMAGGRLEASYRSGKISAQFLAYVDFLMEWAPLHYEIDAGISIRVQAQTFLGAIDLSLGVALSLYGPPFGGRAEIDLSVISFTIDFGASRTQPKLLESWTEFGTTFLDKDPEHWKTPVPASLESPALCQLNVLKGLQMDPAGNHPASSDWIVRGDELELAASTLVPATRLEVGKTRAETLSRSIQPAGHRGRNQRVTERVELETMVYQADGSAVGVRPMGVETLTSVLRVTIVRDEQKVTALELTDWIVEQETMGMAAALWDREKPDPDKGPKDPGAKMIPGCVVGLKSLKPPPGQRAGVEVKVDALEPRILKRRGTLQSTVFQEPPKTGTARPDVGRHVQDGAASRLEIASALREAGFKLPTLEPDPQKMPTFRLLQSIALRSAGMRGGGSGNGSTEAVGGPGSVGAILSQTGGER